tara:strand:- start:86 stop:841 length:756 start_codon:yes stop_codon:yes gene_type:complete
MKYDLVILSHPKDYDKIPFCMWSCMEYLQPKPTEMYLVTPDGVAASSEFLMAFSQGLTPIKDCDAINIEADNIKYRRQNWIYQQFVKLFQNFTTNDLYMCVDSDVIFNNTIRVFENDKPNFFISDRDQHHHPYFRFMEKMHGLSRQVDHTFINDFMLFDKNICREICDEEESYLDSCNDIIDDECLLSEFELYGNYVTKHYPEKYGKCNTKTKMFGRYADQPWSSEELEQIVGHHMHYKKDVDLLTIHTWT